MNKKTLSQLYAEHIGKSSDKWSLYLIEYNRLFDSYRDMAVRLLEIGVQNGGSLEIWSKYFNNASALIGCDVNPKCGYLNFENTRIAVVIGDANAPEVQDRVLQHSSQFDLIIDDGSHLSSDIIKSFVLYFPKIADGGIYIVEDLHCSYWGKFEGGLFDPYSSISFFKRLADVINHEHWGIPKARNDILLGIFTKYGCSVNSEVLSEVHSIEFINSMCVIRKASAQCNSIGRRVIAGTLELVVAGHKNLDVNPYQLNPDHDQSHNQWTTRDTPPDEAIQITEWSLDNAQKQINNLNQTLVELEVNSQKAICSLSQSISALEVQNAQLYLAVKAYQDSTSWRITNPLRIIGKKSKKIRKNLIASRIFILNFKKIVNKILGMRLENIENYLLLLQSQEYVAQLSRERGLSLEFMKFLIKFGVLFFKVKKWWISNYIISFFQSKTAQERKLALSHLRVHIDKPNSFFEIIGDSFMVSGWSVDLNLKTAAEIRLRIGQFEQQLYATPREDVQNVFANLCALPLDLGFIASPSLSIGFHKMWLEVKGLDQTWIPVHQALLLRRPQFTFKELKQGISYTAWTNIEHKQLNAELNEIERHICVMIHKPVFTVIIDIRQYPTGWEKTLMAVRNQIYSYFEVYFLVNSIADMPSFIAQDIKPLLDMTLNEVTGDFIVFINSNQHLSRNAIYEFANAVNQYPDIDLVYGDEDFLSEFGVRCNPFHKPDWSPDYLETFNYIGFPTCFRTSIARGNFDNTHLYDFVLRFTECTTKIFHIPKILGHTQQTESRDVALKNAAEMDIFALQGRIHRTGRQGVVREHEFHPGCYDIELSLKFQPLISIIIPTAGKIVNLGERRIDLIINVIEQIRSRSTYKKFEIIVVDNGDLSVIQEQSITDQGCKRITFTEPIFNISKKLNLGASIADGEYLLLMNDDIEVITPNWLERMLEHFEKPNVGVVGAKLLYTDNCIQHVGVVHNNGNPDHVRRLYSKNDSGYFFSTCGVRNFMAVTGAAMMTLKNIYNSVGGYSEELAVSYNDIDYCLKVREVGLFIVYAPRVVLIHMESQSRIASANMGEVAWYHNRWAVHTSVDPYYNELFLTVASPTFIPFINLRKI